VSPENPAPIGSSLSRFEYLSHPAVMQCTAYRSQFNSNVLRSILESKVVRIIGQILPHDEKSLRE